MQYNPQDYETVKSRKERYYKDNKDARIVVKFTSTDPLEYAMFEARVYKSVEDQKLDCPHGVGYALEVRDKELSTTRAGQKYESVNYSSWTENCEESAVGRALDNAGYSGNKKASREEMDKAQRMNTTMTQYNANPPKVSPKQVNYILTLAKRTGRAETVEEVENLTAQKASALIETMLKELGEKNG